MLRARRRGVRPAVRSRDAAVERGSLPADRRHDSARTATRCCATTSTRSSSARSAIRGCPTTVTRATSCSARGSSSISTSTTGRCKLLDERLCPLKNRTTADVNFVVFRENTEGLYVGIGGRFKAGTDDEVAIQEEVNTYKGVHRIIRHAFEFARANGRRSVCMSDKSNAMTQGHALWQRVFKEVAPQYPEHRGAASLHRRARAADGAGSRAVRRHRDEQPVRRHHHRPRRGAAGRARRWRRRATCIRAGRRCSSRCTGRRRRSPARTSRTRWAPSCRRRCMLRPSRAEAGGRGDRSRGASTRS